MDRTWQVNNIRRVEDVRPIVRQHAVVGIDVVGVFHVAGNVAVETLAVARTQHLAEGVVRGEGGPAGLLLPGHDDRVVVRVTTVGQQLYTGVVMQRVVVVGRKAPGKRIVNLAV